MAEIGSVRRWPAVAVTAAPERLVAMPRALTEPPGGAARSGDDGVESRRSSPQPGCAPGGRTQPTPTDRAVAKSPHPRHQERPPRHGGTLFGHGNPWGDGLLLAEAMRDSVEGVRDYLTFTDRVGIDAVLSEKLQRMVVDHPSGRYPAACRQVAGLLIGGASVQGLWALLPAAVRTGSAGLVQQLLTEAEQRQVLCDVDVTPLREAGLARGLAVAVGHPGLWRVGDVLAPHARWGQLLAALQPAVQAGHDDAVAWVLGQAQQRVGGEPRRAETLRAAIDDALALADRLGKPRLAVVLRASTGTPRHGWWRSMTAWLRSQCLG